MLLLAVSSVFAQIMIFFWIPKDYDEWKKVAKSNEDNRKTLGKLKRLKAEYETWVWPMTFIFGTFYLSAFARLGDSGTALSSGGTVNIAGTANIVASAISGTVQIALPTGANTANIAASVILIWLFLGIGFLLALARLYDHVRALRAMIEDLE